MSMKKVYAIVVGLVFLAAPAFAADVDGKWTGSVSTPMGDLPVQYEFKAEGTSLTGTTLGFDGGSVPIKNGKVDGDKISFTVTFDLGGMSLDLSYTGVVTASEIKMTGDFMGMPFEFTVKKA
jgi:opacity protein-like surface antigen